eukprot:s90_g43.t1
MHNLYLHYVGCKANWQKSTLLIEIRKSHSLSSVELWEWWTLEKMEEKLGKTLAEDLKQRHLAEEARNPDFPKEEKLWEYRNYAGMTETKKRKFETSATLRDEADMDQDEALNVMCLVGNGSRHTQAFSTYMCNGNFAMLCAHACIFAARPRDAATEEMANPDSITTDRISSGGGTGLPDPRPRNETKPKKEKKEKSLEQLAQSV